MRTASRDPGESRERTVAGGPRPGSVADSLGRPLHDLRISVTDRCNLRCRYCMPREVFGPGFAFLPHAELLTFEELARVAGILCGLGVRKLRLTGGEPLVRRDLERLVAMLADLPARPELAMTTNGVLLPSHAGALADAGLDRVTVSLDSLDDATFMAMNGVGMPVSAVLRGIEAARTAGLGPVKINMVVKRGANETSIPEMARWARDEGHVLRFIEYMDVGSTNGWHMADVVPAEEILATVDAAFPLEPVEPAYTGEVASRWRYRDGVGEVGVIASVTRPFCGACTRARLSAEGMLYTCLFATDGMDLRGPLRSGRTDEEVAALVTGRWAIRDDRYSEIRTLVTLDRPKVEMSRIGG